MGRTQRCPADNFFYTQISYVRAVGAELEGFNTERRFEFTGFTDGGADEIQAYINQLSLVPEGGKKLRYVDKGDVMAMAMRSLKAPSAVPITVSIVKSFGAAFCNHVP